MTITERNKQLFELREMLTKKEQEIAWIKQNIWLVNEMYDRENRDTPLFDEMFGGWCYETLSSRYWQPHQNQTGVGFN